MPVPLGTKGVFRLIGAAVGLSLLVACEPPAPKPEGLQLTALTYDRLPGWTEDDPRAALAAFLRSCAMLTAPRPTANGQNNAELPGGLTLTPADWEAPCTEAVTLSTAPGDAVRTFFERSFRPFAAAGPDGAEGLFTGYFEIELLGARLKSVQFPVPLYRLPQDHVQADLGVFDPDLKGKRIVGRVEQGRFIPYFSRGDIERGALTGRGLEMLWVNDPVDVFMLHVQGSGRVVLRDGSIVRVGFAGHNGRPYESIGRTLIEKGELQPGKASWEDIRDWIRRNPAKAQDLFAANPRFIFFRVIEGVPPEAGPIGAQGVPLTPGRSMAVDRRYIPLGVPLWLDTTWPSAPDRPLRRLMVAQDAGGAIQGVVRGDFFWGFGSEALAEAGKMKSRGRYYLLIPAAAAARLPQS
jgi:membrane-bound lytic murein transglycosylase A